VIGRGNFLFFLQRFIFSNILQQCMMHVFKGIFQEPFSRLIPFPPSTLLWLRPQAAAGGGLCVITTRQAVTDLESRRGFAVKEILLEHLSEAAGVELLRPLGVTTGSEQDFRLAVAESPRPQTMNIEH
jgi:hypothetical protein